MAAHRRHPRLPPMTLTKMNKVIIIDLLESEIMACHTSILISKEIDCAASLNGYHKKFYLWEEKAIIF